MCALLHRFLRSHGNKAHLSVLIRDQNHDAAGELALELIAEAAQLVHIHAGNVGCDKRNACDLLHAVHHIAEARLRFLGLHGLIFGFHFLEFLLQRLNLLRQCGRRSL